MVRVYDLAMTHKLDADDYFIHRVQQRCAELGLNFFLIEPLWVDVFREQLSAGGLQVRVLLNMHSEHHLPEDSFHRLVRAAHEHGVQVIDPPDVALAAFDKARLHHRLEAAGLAVPFTVIVPRSQAAGFVLSAADRERLGSPFVIKPSLGYGRNGVVLDATSERDLGRSMASWPDANYLLQRRIVARQVGEAPAYFRVYFVFGVVWCCWWNCFTDRYRRVSPEEWVQLKLERLEAVVRRIADLTGMRFFSTEIAEMEAGELVVIDYVNDQCHMVTQTSNPHMGVPDDLVAAVARRLVDGAGELLGRAPAGGRP